MKSVFTFNVTHLLKLINHETNFLFLPLRLELPLKILLNFYTGKENKHFLSFNFSAPNLIEQVALCKIESVIKKIESVKVVFAFSRRFSGDLYAV